MIADFRTWLVFAFLVLLAAGSGRGAVNAVTPPAAEAAVDQELSKQLKINKVALFEGSTEQIRMDAAAVLLDSEEPQARQIVVEALQQTAVPDARVAVCRALDRCHELSKHPQRPEDFAEPLLEIIRTEKDLDVARLAAEAMLVLDSDQIMPLLERIATDSAALRQARLNAMYALQLRSDSQVISKLRDDPDESVAAAAREYLKSPSASDDYALRQHLQERLSQLEQQLDKRSQERDYWRKKYLSALDQVYGCLKDDVEKTKFLIGHLKEQEPEVKLWALGKLHQWRLGPKSRLPTDELGDALKGLISDENRNVRLKTAQLLGLMVELNCADNLLEQLKVEQDEEVRMELFAALGGACYFALTPNSGVKVSDKVKTETLAFAGEYLKEPGLEKPVKGAEVIRKMFEHNGWDEELVSKYLKELVDRYKRTENDNQSRALRGELLRTMASLCAQGSYKAQCTQAFGPLFEKALRAEADIVREAAVDGLIYVHDVDKKRALDVLKGEFANDASSRIRAKVVDLAQRVGGEEDLFWLAEKLDTPQEHQPAWQAMLEIFKRCQASVAVEWLERLEPRGENPALSEDEWMLFLETAVRKAEGPEDKREPELLKRAWEKMAVFSAKKGNFTRSAEYWGKILELESEPAQRAVVRAKLVQTYLGGTSFAQAAEVVHITLLEKDLASDDPVVDVIEAYLANPAAEADPNRFLAVLAEKTADIDMASRPIWKKHVMSWSERLALNTASKTPARPEAN